MIANVLSHQAVYGKEPLVAYYFNPLSIGLCAMYVFQLLLNVERQAHVIRLYTFRFLWLAIRRSYTTQSCWGYDTLELWGYTEGTLQLVHCVVVSARIDAAYFHCPQFQRAVTEWYCVNETRCIRVEEIGMCTCTCC